VNNFRLRLTPNDREIQLPFISTWDLNGVNEGIDEFQNEIAQKIINPIDDYEVTRFSHNSWSTGITENLYTSVNYDFYFYNSVSDSSITATTNSNDWLLDYTANGLTTKEIYYYNNVFSKSYFKLDFYSNKISSSQQILLTIIIPTQQGKTMDATIGLNNVKIKIPSYELNYVGDKEGYYVYWLKDKQYLDVNTLYMTAKFYDASIGQFKRLMNVSQGNLLNKFNFPQQDNFYYTMELNYNNYTYEVFYEDNSGVRFRVGTSEQPIKWYEYVNP
jgi:hypothetical protein